MDVCGQGVARGVGKRDVRCMVIYAIVELGLYLSGRVFD